MRIAIISLGFPEHSSHLCQALSKNNDVFLGISDRIGEESGPYRKMLENFLSDKIQLFTFRNHPKKDIRNLSLISKLKRKIKDFEPDTICVQGGGLWLLLLLPFFLKYHFVLDLHDHKPLAFRGSSSYSRITDYVTRIFIFSSKNLIVHSEIARREVLELYHYDPDRIFVLRRGEYSITKSYDYNSEIKVRKKLILLFGCIKKHKGVDILVQAGNIISSKIPDVKIAIIGYGSYDGYKKYLGDASNYIRINREIPWRYVSYFFRRTDVVVLPYLDASQSGVLSTAFAYRKPVVASSVGGITEMIKNNETGVLVAPNNPEELAEGIIKLITDEEFKKRIINNLDEELKTNLSWENLTRQISGAFDDKI